MNAPALVPEDAKEEEVNVTKEEVAESSIYMLPPLVLAVQSVNVQPEMGRVVEEGTLAYTAPPLPLVQEHSTNVKDVKVSVVGYDARLSIAPFPFDLVIELNLVFASEREEMGYVVLEY